MRLRTYLLLALTVASGTGIGVFSMYADGMYSAICLFVFPLFSAPLFGSIAYDIARPRVAPAREFAAKTAITATPATLLPKQTTAAKVATVNRAAATTG